MVTDGGPRRRHVGGRLGVPSPEAVSTRTGADRGIRGLVYDARYRARSWGYCIKFFFNFFLQRLLVSDCIQGCKVITVTE